MLAVPCNSCAMPLPEWELATGAPVRCPDCGVSHEVRLFPAALFRATADTPESAEEGEATCFDHPSSKAVAACAQCGRFVCQLCAVEIKGSTYCPSCVAAGLSDRGSRG